MTEAIANGTSADQRPPAGGKRERLIEAARQTIHRQGVEGTTLADIATAADVPLGNVYYYFRTKDELVAAVVDSHAEIVRATLSELDKGRTPKARLTTFIRLLASQADTSALYGCPQGTLCSELDKREDRICDPAILVTLPIDWAEKQFRELGRRDARELAVALIASYQGASLLTNTLRDPKIMATEARRLERWIDALG
jgi:AcrR family transcriptional regulator